MSRSLRFITFDHLPSRARKIGLNLLHEKQVLDLTNAFGFRDMRSFLEERSQNLSKIDEKCFQIINSGKNRISLTDVHIKAPIYNPDKIICVGLNYLDHAKETNMPVPAEPILFSKYSTSIIGPEDEIVKPEETKELDYEAELVIVVGKEGRYIKESKAMEYIAGYTVGHDVSARDWQLKKSGGQWMVGKTWDTFAPIGPSIVTNVENVHNLGIRCILNNQVVQNSNTSQLIFKSEKLISYISQILTLKPGDLIFTGTPPGVGTSRKPQLYMKPGDKVTIEIDTIGSLTNSVVSPKHSNL